MPGKLDGIIVGQGIAGSMLAWHMHKSGKSFIVLDKGSSTSSSAVSSGIINPITGHRFVKSWMIEHLLPQAKRIYREIENTLDIKILEVKPIVRRLSGIQAENQWYSRLEREDYRVYMKEEYKGPQLSCFINTSDKLGELHGSCLIDIRQLLSAFRKWLLEIGCLRETDFVYDALDLREHSLIYEDLEGDQLLFAEGWKVSQNPLFNHLTFAPAKGEVLICHIPDFPEDYIIKYKKFIVPLGNSTYWIGSTYKWNFKDDIPDIEKAEELKDFLKKYIKIPYKVLDHLSGIRPATEYRRPYVGTHPAYPNIHILNGLGTKGMSLAPFWSEALVNQIYQPGYTIDHKAMNLPEILRV